MNVRFLKQLIPNKVKLIKVFDNKTVSLKSYWKKHLQNRFSLK